MSQEPDSANLDELKKLLAKSFDGDRGDDVPPLPDSLRDRIAGQYNRNPEPTPKDQAEGIFSWLTSLFAQPAFAGVAAALVLLVTATVLLRSPENNGQFRGETDSSSVTLVLFQVGESTAEGLRSADLFDENAIQHANTTAELEAIAPPRVVIDGSTGTIKAYAEGADAPLEVALPTTPQDIADAVADLLQQIR